MYRFWVPGAARSAAKKLAATDARWYSIGSFRTAKMEIPVKTKYADWTGLDAGVPRDVQRVYKEHL